MLPGLIMPLIILNITSSDNSAYFYIAWTIANLIFVIPYATNLSLLAESSYNSEELRKQISKAAKFILIILLPLIIATIFLIKYPLVIFGENYVNESTALINLLVISSIPVAINELYIAINRIKKRIVPIIIIYGFISLITIVSSYLSLNKYGIVAIGVSWIAANSLAAIIILLILYRQKFFLKNKRL